MLKRKNGFGLIELIVSLMLASIIMIMLYRYFTKTVRTMGDSVIVTALRNNSRLVFNNIVSDIKEIGYNPLGKFDSDNNSIFGFTDQGHIDHQSDLSKIEFTTYNSDYPDCPTDGIPSNCTIRYKLEDNKVIRESYQLSEPMVMARNACLKFFYCSKNGNQDCSDQDGDPRPTSVIVILGVTNTPERTALFDSECKISSLTDKEYIRFQQRVAIQNFTSL